MAVTRYGDGGRPRAEFVNHKPRHHRTPQPAPLTPTWPEIRVSRRADIGPGAATDDWHIFLAELGRSNYGKGRACSIGSVAITMVSAKEMGYMLQKRFPRAYSTPDKTARLHAKVAGGIADFVRSRQRLAYNEVTLRMELAMQATRSEFSFVGMSNHLEEPPEADPLPCPQPPAGAGSDIESAVPATYFGDAVFAVDGLELFGGGYGADLSSNEQLYSEREDLRKFLRSDVCLDTSALNNSWKPHGTVFELLPQLRAVTLTYQAERPASIALDQPRSLLS